MQQTGNNGQGDKAETKLRFKPELRSYCPLTSRIYMIPKSGEYGTIS